MPEAMTRTQYDQMAGFYDRLWRSYIANSLAVVTNWAQVRAHETVLDVACGTGAFESILLTSTPAQAIVGIDISGQMLAIAARKCGSFPNVVFQRARASALPCRARSCDVIVSANAFHYFDAPLLVLAEMQRVLKPGGRLVILDWCKDFPLCALCDSILSVIDPAHQHCYTQHEFHSLLDSAGFDVRQASRVRFGLVWGLMIVVAVPTAPPAALSFHPAHSVRNS